MRFGRSRSKLPLAGTFNAFCFGADNQFVARGLEISAQNTTEVTPRAQSDDGQAKAAASAAAVLQGVVAMFAGEIQHVPPGWKAEMPWPDRKP